MVYRTLGDVVGSPNPSESIVLLVNVEGDPDAFADMVESHDGEVLHRTPVSNTFQIRVPETVVGKIRSHEAAAGVSISRDATVAGGN